MHKKEEERNKRVKDRVENLERKKKKKKELERKEKQRVSMSVIVGMHQ